MKNNKKNSNPGVVFTPKSYARILTSWAIRSKNDKILDLGIGMGVFVYQAFERLKKLGALKKEAINQIYGTEIDNNIYNEFLRESSLQGLFFPNLGNIDFFDYSYPDVDVIIGNPPYIRRRQMGEDEVSFLQERTFLNNNKINEKNLLNSTDLYIYFLLNALPKLKFGGRMAIILSDTWLNARYGSILKKYLLSEFTIDEIVCIDRSVFYQCSSKSLYCSSNKNGRKNQR